jgi:hypothetical protein
MNFHKASLYLFIALGLTVSSCGDDANSDDTSSDGPKTETKTDPNSTGILKVGDKLFNLPSPLEAAFLIEEVGGLFTEELLNPDIDAGNYTTKKAQAMNLGIYGADLGYSLIYNQSQSVSNLLATCKKLGSEIGISPALYTTLMKRFEGNMENRDSLLLTVTQLNSLSDEYLKENESEDVSALIFYGGWIGSLYFNTQLVDQLGNERLRARIGEQKNSLENLIGLIGQVNIDGDLDDIVNDLEGLKVVYEKVEYNYEWIEPETMSDKNLTIIKSKSSVTVSDDVLKEISNKIREIRNSIIGPTV